jgi:hypothetical protein
MWLSGCLPLAYYVAGASAHGTWFEGAALVGAAAELGVAPPPGAPLSSLLASLLTLLPVGPLPFRVACANAVFVAMGLALFARALFNSLHGLGARQVGVNAALALAAALIVARGPGAWLTATQASVYALEWLFALAIVDALVRHELNEPTDDMRLLLFAAFVQGLAFANHYVLALLTLPAAAPTLGRVFARRGFIGLMGHAVLPLFGFSAYVYIPIRAAQHPTLDFGEPNTLRRLFALLIAEPFWGPPGAQASALDVLSAFARGLAGPFWLLCLLALVGLVLARRAYGRRRFAVLWGVLLVVPLGCLTLLIRPTLEADRFGALLPSSFALAALAAIGVALVLEALPALRGSALALHGSRGLAGLAVLGMVSSASEAPLVRFDASDAVADLTRRALPEGALVLSHDPDTLLRHLGGEVEERSRPDLAVVPLTGIAPAPLDRLLEERPELGPLLRDVVVRGRPALATLQSLAVERPVFLELDAHSPPELYATLVTEGLLSRVLPDGTTPGDERLASAQLAPRLARLRARLSASPPGPDAAQRLAQKLVYQALQAASLDDRDAARALLGLAAELVPPDARARALSAALAGEGPIDVPALGTLE